MTANEIKSHWNERAKSQPNSATTNDVWLRELETRTLAREIRKLEPRIVLDLGCGDGATTIRLACLFPATRFIGIDYSYEMLELAARSVEIERYRRDLVNITFYEADLQKDSYPAHDLAISCRCLINLASKLDQHMVLARLSNFRLIENFSAPHAHLNILRKQCGLLPIEIQPTNTYLNSDIDSEGFADSYYFATRVIYAHECRWRHEEPNYLSDHHRWACELPNISLLHCAPMRMLSSALAGVPND